MGFLSGGSLPGGGVRGPEVGVGVSAWGISVREVSVSRICPGRSLSRVSVGGGVLSGRSLPWKSLC